MYAWLSKCGNKNARAHFCLCVYACDATRFYASALDMKSW